jgi:hypothetical protein
MWSLRNFCYGATVTSMSGTVAVTCSAATQGANRFGTIYGQILAATKQPGEALTVLRRSVEMFGRLTRAPASE